MIEHFQTSNSRLLLIESLDEGNDWRELWPSLKQFVHGTHDLKLANENLYLYFFCSSAEEHFIEHGVQVGVEVIGFINEVPEELQIWDLNPCFAIQKSCHKWPDWEELFALEREMRSQSSKKLAETWRVQFPVRGKELSLKNIKVQLFEEQEVEK